jgi:hypothetical protein
VRGCLRTDAVNDIEHTTTRRTVPAYFLGRPAERYTERYGRRSAGRRPPRTS